MFAYADIVPTIARMMALSAETAPKARGADALRIRVVDSDSLIALANEMRRHGEARNLPHFIRDSDNVRVSDAVLLIGLEYHTTAGLDCGACGFPTCEEMLQHQTSVHAPGMPFQGPSCAVRVTDLGIALGSAVKTASLHNLDNRIMYTAGVAALRLGWLEGCSMGYGIPLSAGPKNIFFDRG
ncbi:MAG: DUF2148 domain-containing protein [Methanomicrobiales archaeon]|nr:DUF2148 domain-containing protein [Methanomicrobiales archaeon]